MSIDLHIHTTISDGTMTPGEIVTLASKKGLKAIAITDHDTFAGVEEAQLAGKGVGLEVISGIELSAQYQDINIHLLGYLFDHKDENFIAALRKIQAGRIERNLRIIERLNKLKIELTIEEVEEFSIKGQVGRPHIASLLVRKGYVDTMDEAFEIYLGSGGLAYESRYLFQLPEAIANIKRAGGLAILAHPYHIYNNCKNFKRYLDELSAMGLDGIEAYYPTHSRKFRKELLQLSTEKSLLVTGGSDFHGDIRPGTTLAGGKNVSVPYDLLHSMKKQVDVEQS